MTISSSTQAIIESARNEGRTFLTEIESKELLKQAGINAVETKLATSATEAVTVSRQLGFPVALKIASPDIVHKSDAGGVRLGLATPTQVRKAYAEILALAGQKYPQARVQGVSVQKMAPPGIEVIVGMTKDAQFGPVLVFGLGGVWVEVLKDTSLRIIPITRKDAGEMVQEIKGYQLLKGYRGQAPADISRLEDLLLKVSGFVEQNPEIKELDLNPVIASSHDAVAVDARVILEDASSIERVRQEDR